MINFFRKLFSVQKPVVLVYKTTSDSWTYVELQLPRSSQVLVSAHNEAEYTFFDVGNVRYHVAVSGSSDVGFSISNQKFDRQQIAEPTHMMLRMDRLFQESRQPHTCSVLGCGRPATMDLVCIRWEMESDFGSFSTGTPYQVCESPEHLVKVKEKNPRALRYSITPHRERTSQLQ